MYTEDTHRTLLPQYKLLRAIFERYAKPKPNSSGGVQMWISEWEKLVKDTNLADGALNQREIRLAFVRSKMIVSDEFSLSWVACTFTDFLEALVRLSVTKLLPRMADFTASGHLNMDEFMLAFQKNPSGYELSSLS